jgi:MFS family permease
LDARQRTFGALRDPTFRRVLAFGGFYYTYRATELAVLSWFVLTLTDSELQVALVGVSRIGPMFLFGIFAGSLSDRFARPRLMAAGQAVNLAAAAFMALLLWSNSAEAWHVYPIVFVTGTTWALDYASRRALLADIFSGRALTNALSLDAGLVTGSQMIGPLLGTALISIVSFEGAYAGITLLTLAALSIVLSVRARPRAGAPRSSGSPFKQVRDAIGIMRSNRAVLAAVLVTIVFNMFGWPAVQMVSVVARDQLGVGEVAFGLLLSAMGAGALMGAVAFAWAQPTSSGNIFTLSTAAFMGCSIGFAWAPWYPLSLVFMYGAGVSLSGFAVMQPSIPLAAVAPELRGRAMGAIVLGIGFQAIGMTAVGLLAEVAGPRLSISVMALMGIALIVVLRGFFPILRGKTPKPKAG